MIKILLNGCNGRMGQVITRLDSENDDVTIAAGVDISPEKCKNFYNVHSTLSDVKEDFDVIIDFSNIKGLPSILEFATLNKKPVVYCTTGLSPDDRDKINAASNEIPILTSANMSIGINLILDLVKQCAPILEDSFDIEIVEKHHNQKADSPSGTALAIADAINDSLSQKYEYTYGRHSKTEKRSPKEIGIHALRGGNIVGEHTVYFAGAGEVIEIKHTALSRDVFGVGALKAAKYLYNKEAGLYSMDDIISQG